MKHCDGVQRASNGVANQQARRSLQFCTTYDLTHYKYTHLVTPTISSTFLHSKLRSKLLLLLNLLPINDNHRLPLNLPAMHHLHQLVNTIQPLKRIRLHSNAMLSNTLQHPLTLLRTTYQTPMDPDIPENQLRKWDGHILRLRDLNHEAMHLRHGTGERGGGGSVRDAEGGVCAHTVGYGVDFFDGGFFAFAGVDDGVGAVGAGEGEAFVAGVDADYIESEGFCELDA